MSFVTALVANIRGVPSGVVEMLMSKGWVSNHLTEEQRAKLDSDITEYTNSLFGEEKKSEKAVKKAKPQVADAPPMVITREYLETLTVPKLREIGKDCAAIKGRKPRADIITYLVQYFGTEPTVEAVESEDELHAEPVPQVDKKKAAKPKAAPKAAKAEPKAVKEKKEKKPKGKKEAKEEERIFSVQIKEDDLELFQCDVKSHLKLYFFFHIQR